MTPKPRKRPSINSLALKYGLGEKTLDRWKKDGIDIYDETVVEQYRNLTQSPECNDSKKDNITSLNAFELKRRKLEADTRDKEAVASMRELELQQLEGSLVALQEVCEAQIAIAAKIKAQLKALEVTLPPKLSGLNDKQMAKIIKEHNREILNYLYNEFKMNDEKEETDS